MNQWVRIGLFLPVILALMVAAWVNLPLFQDGAAYLYQLMDTKAVAIMNQRFGALLVQILIVLSLHFLSLSPAHRASVGLTAANHRSLQSSPHRFYRRMVLLFGTVTLGRIGWAIAFLPDYEKSFLEAHQRNHYLFAASTADRLFRLISLIIGIVCLFANAAAPIHYGEQPNGLYGKIFQGF